MFDVPASPNALQLSGIQLLRLSILILVQALQKSLQKIRNHDTILVRSPLRYPYVFAIIELKLLCICRRDLTAKYICLPYGNS